MISSMAEAPNYTPKQIAALRDRLGLSVAEAADKVGVSRISWWQWEAGKRRPSLQSRLLILLLAQGKLP